MIADHNEIQKAVREKLRGQTKTVVSGNPVNRFATADNRECIDFLLKVRDGLGLADKYDLMIDASAGDLWSDGGYRLPITDGSVRTPEQFHDYWMDIIRQYGLRILEDPFREQDPESWSRLTTSQSACLTIGDNFYSSSAGADRGRCGPEAHARRRHQAQPGRARSRASGGPSKPARRPARSPSPRTGPSAPKRPSSPRSPACTASGTSRSAPWPRTTRRSCG
ncbi:MAG: hypothetical protein M0C28_27700 [Candidatus Moduliflexus flocculans]|nr:hypothetical protein [Candidatus Moduliflexus flocculans]